MILFWILFSLASGTVFGAISGSIYELDRGAPGEESLILLSSGEVLRLEDSIAPELWDELWRLRNTEARLRFEVDFHRRLLSWQEVAPKEEPSGGVKLAPSNYVPTVFPSVAEAKVFLHSMNPNALPKAECYNRAHVWTFEGAKKQGILGMKIWLFFTKKYIREHNFEWWFHVSPFTYVREDGTVRERTLDRKYARDPLLIKDWTDIFMRNRAPCPLVKRYSDYRRNQESESCYVMKTNMYYYQPIELERLESRGALKASWLNWELKNAYRQAFGIDQVIDLMGF